MIDPERLAPLLSRLPDFTKVTANDLVAMPAKGVSNDHLRIKCHDAVVRLPGFSQWQQAAADHFNYQRAAFTRAEPSGHTPRLIATLPPGAGLDGGALIVADIAGHPPRLPDDLPAIATALAALHNLPVPPAAERAPLLTYNDPFRDTLAVVETQAMSLQALDADDPVRIAMNEELQWARSFTPRSTVPPPVLTGTDTHPGNFLIDDAGKAWFVDLEKLVYGSPAVDLAHATLPTSVGWDPDCAVDLAPIDVKAFYARYLQSMADPAAARALAPWLQPLRRLTWLRTMTWFVRWHTDWNARALTTMQSDDMSRHIERHVAHCLDPKTIAATRADWLDP